MAQGVLTLYGGQTKCYLEIVHKFKNRGIELHSNLCLQSHHKIKLHTIFLILSVGILVRLVKL